MLSTAAPATAPQPVVTAPRPSATGPAWGGAGMSKGQPGGPLAPPPQAAHDLPQRSSARAYSSGMGIGGGGFGGGLGDRHQDTVCKSPYYLPAYTCFTTSRTISLMELVPSWAQDSVIDSVGSVLATIVHKGPCSVV